MREVSLHFVRWIVRFGLGAVSMLSPFAAVGTGDSYPHRPIRFVLAQSPAAVVDGVMRQITDKLTATLGVPLLVENRPGASGNIASAYVAKQMPDGYTFLVGATGMMTLPTTLGSQAVDPLRALTPVCKLITQPIVIVVHLDSHINSLGELLERARRSPAPLLTRPLVSALRTIWQPSC
jgi:tripartite-type tricarboxylate transporter receptor subunit TctC